MERPPPAGAPLTGPDNLAADMDGNETARRRGPTGGEKRRLAAIATAPLLAAALPARPAAGAGRRP